MYFAQICYAIENLGKDENGCVMLNSADWRIETVLIQIEEFCVHHSTIIMKRNAMARLAPYHCLLSNSQDEKSTIKHNYFRFLKSYRTLLRSRRHWNLKKKNLWKLYCKLHVFWPYCTNTLSLDASCWLLTSWN